ncbi:MAG: glycosyltransferase family 1 protein [Candidatus Bathyarchaeia archaeon]
MLKAEPKQVCYAAPPELTRKTGGSIRVLAVFFHPSTSVTAIGGAEKRFVETLKLLCENDAFKFCILESSPSLLANSEMKCFRRLVSLRLSGVGWLGNYFCWVLWALKTVVDGLELAKKAKPQIIFVPNNTFPNLFAGSVLGLILRRQLCVVVHHIDLPSLNVGGKGACSLYGCYRSVGYSRAVALIKAVAFHVTIILLRRANAIIAVSSFTAESLRRSGVLKAEIFVSGNAVDAKLIENVKLSKDAKDIKIYDAAFVGRISKEKGIFDLLEAWKKVVEVKSDAKLLIVGSGLELEPLKEAVALCGLDKNVFVRGRCADVELFQLLKQSKVFVFPSLFEGWGISVAEALACGLPVVAYDIPALREVFGKCKSVFLVPVKDIDGLASRILKVLGKNAQECESLSLASKSYVARFSWEKVASRDSEILRLLCAVRH